MKCDDRPRMILISIFQWFICTKSTVFEKLDSIFSYKATPSNVFHCHHRHSNCHDSRFFNLPSMVSIGNESPNQWVEINKRNGKHQKRKCPQYALPVRLQA